MSPERSNAYRRVMTTLEDIGPSKLLESEQQRIRYAADNALPGIGDPWAGPDQNQPVDPRS